MAQLADDDWRAFVTLSAAVPTGRRPRVRSGDRTDTRIYKRDIRA